MSLENDYLPFCETDTGSNLEEQATYLADPNRLIGNQPGIASSQFVNKALRQANAVTSQLAQYVSNQMQVNTLDDGTPSNLLSQITAALSPLGPQIISYTSGTATWNCPFYFFIASGNATSGATYTNNSFTFTVSATISAGTLLSTTGTGLPLAQGTLTKASGTGDTTITFLAYRMPLFIRLKAKGSGGSGSNSGTTGFSSGSNGNATTIGSLISAGAGSGGTPGGGGQGGSGGTNTITSPALVIRNKPGGTGSGTSFSGNATSGFVGLAGGPGGGPGGGGGAVGTAGQAAPANSGAGGGGGGTGTSNANAYSGSGGGEGGELDAYVPQASIPITLAVSIGASVAGAGAGTNGFAGGASGSGYAVIESWFQ
jgi:hypothetical protein